MEASEPVGPLYRSLGEKLIECLASYRLGGGFVEAGGDPLLASPVAGIAYELTQVPLPFQDFLGLRKYANQPKRVDAGERELWEGNVHDLRRTSRGDGWNDFTATHWIGGHAPRNRIPIDKGESYA